MLKEPATPVKIALLIWNKAESKQAGKIQSHIATYDVVLMVVSGPPVEVGVTMYVLSISSLSEVKMVLSYFIPVLPQSLSARPLPDSRAWRPGEAGWCYVMVIGLQALPWRWESQCTCWASARCPRSRWYLSMPDLYMLCVPSPVSFERARIERGRRRAGLGHEFDLVFMSRLRIFAVTGPPVEVGVTMYVLSISSVSEVLMVQNNFFYIVKSLSSHFT